MIDRSELIRQANELRQQAELEADENIRNRLLSMAERYVHLAESETWSEAHPADAVSLSEVFTKRE
jgi:two-component sensor histidine kinase